MTVTRSERSEPGVPILVTGWGAGWGNYTPTVFAPASYWKDRYGRVRLSGLVKGTANTRIFTLPVGYQPSFTVRFPAITDGTKGQIAVTASGVFSYGGVGSGIEYVSLDGIIFEADD